LSDCDVVIAACTGNNPNVFYELGIAHALGKDVILITQDSIRDMPSDVRHFEFIKYDLGSDQPFFSHLDAAIREIITERYIRVFNQAMSLFLQIRDEVMSAVNATSRDEFVDFVKAAESSEGVPSIDDEGFAEFALPAIIKESGEASVMGAINGWLRGRTSRS
jgi:hypothetical protein